MGNPGKNHWEATNWVFRYLCGSINKGLHYKHPKSTELELYGFVDLDYAGDLDKRKSLTVLLCFWGKYNFLEI